MANAATAGGGDLDYGPPHDCLISIRLTSSGRELLHVSKERIRTNLLTRGFADDPQLKEIEEKDVTRGVYEGGLKVWEGAIDMCNFIDDPANHIVCTGKSIFEIGCGSGLPGILAMQKGAREVHLQDFNRAVLECFTRDNVVANGVPLHNCHLIDGDWKNCAESLEGKRFDLILTSETIYEENNYGKLHNLIDRTLAEDGIALVQAKTYYFGVGGNVPEFLEFVKLKGLFEVVERWTSASDLPRWIVEMRRK